MSTGSRTADKTKILEKCLSFILEIKEVKHVMQTENNAVAAHREAECECV